MNCNYNYDLLLLCGLPPTQKREPEPPKIPGLERVSFVFYRNVIGTRKHGSILFATTWRDRYSRLKPTYKCGNPWKLRRLTLQDTPQTLNPLVNYETRVFHEPWRGWRHAYYRGWLVVSRLIIQLTHHNSFKQELANTVQNWNTIPGVPGRSKLRFCTSVTLPHTS